MASTQRIGFLTDKEIIKQGNNLIKDFEPNLVRGASYDLRLGEEAYISGEEYPKLLTGSNTDSFVTIPRGQFAMLLTKEYVTVPPSYLAFISIKFDKKAQGLVNISGFHVDPGFEGKIIFTVFNAGPTDVVLRYEEPVFMIFFYKLHDRVQYPYDRDKKGQKCLPTKLVTLLKGTSASLSDVDRRLSRIETLAWVFLGLLVGLVGAIIGVATR